jgi:beta-1,4-mannosyl-glycoprotein beta-1,4-N-acetylglucosaminyltransferase
MRIHDASLFYNEVDLLEMRLVELFPIVDRFFIFEGSKTFTGIDKISFFWKNMDRWAPYRSKIELVTVSDWPESSDPWHHEFHQRNRMVLAASGLDQEDIVLFSDADEIPSRASVECLKSSKASSFAFEQTFSYFKFDYIAQNIPLHHSCWTIGERVGNLSGASINELRASRQARIEESVTNNRDNLCVFRDAGWHASYLGDEEFVKNKIRNFSHQEYNNSEFLESINISSIIKSHIDLYGRSTSKWSVAEKPIKVPILVSSEPQRFSNYFVDTRNIAQPNS